MEHFFLCNPRGGGGGGGWGGGIRFIPRDEPGAVGLARGREAKRVIEHFCTWYIQYIFAHLC